MANTITYDIDYDAVLQDRLDHPTTWKEMCDVNISDTRQFASNYMSTTPSVQTVTRGTAAAIQDFGLTQESGTINTGRDLGLYLDLADEAQSPWTTPAELFNRIGALINEYVETAVLARHASWTDFGTEGLTDGAGSTQITVSASNIDDIIRGIKREIRQANGQSFMNERGVGFVWGPLEFEYLEAFAQANGFASADEALREGTVEGLRYLGADHYWSNDNTANHRFAGVKKVERLGILRGTYGRAHTIPFPAGTSNNFLSGTAYYSRVDVGHLTPTAHAGLVFDINTTT